MKSRVRMSTRWSNLVRWRAFSKTTTIISTSSSPPFRVAYTSHMSLTATMAHG
eukprot:CAMPEP_0119149554 /NCGR_PEP_ID=MMETSP1310-20130426/43505_1 /TAXON_ID=464262 /ORGANISM="Genus nov. species nov., Strain RCC2339" /LENGTH=52 /DNA_ID=CAMNT_0007141671 /DNA_START=44 /DNA_END=202 /DNA_ORIENTATION=-